MAPPSPWPHDPGDPPLPTGTGAPEDRSRTRENRAIAATALSAGVAVVVVLAILFLALPPAPASASSSGSGVHVATVEWELAGLPCSGDPEIYETPGTTVVPGAAFTENDSLVNAADLGSCTFAGPSVGAGFTLISSNLPLTLSAGQNATLSVEIGAPSTPWSGTLVVSVGVSTAL